MSAFYTAGMQYILFFLTALLTFVLAFPVFAENAPPAPQYPAGVKEKYTRDCMEQPLPPQYSLFRKVTDRQRYAYCLCQFNFFQATVKYPHYVHIDSLVRQGTQGMKMAMQTYPWFFPHFQKSVETCAPPFLVKNH